MTTIGLKQGGCLSALLFSIYIEELFERLDALNVGLRIDKSLINCLVYADDIFLLSYNKSGLQKMLNAINLFSLDREIKFNPQKTVFIVFNKNIKLNNKWKKNDDDKIQLKLSGELIKEVSQFKYLGIEIHNQLSSKPHLNAREELFYTRLSELNHVGMDNIKTSSKYRAMLYKTYARPVLMYGMDLVNMNIGQLKHLQTTEANALKIATDISTRCRTTNLLKAYTVTTTKDLIITKKCSLFIRLLANSYTRTIIESIIAESHNHFITDSFLNEIVMITQINSMNLV